MNSFSIPRLSVTVLIFLLVNPLFGAEPPLSLEEVAKILGYPADKLKVEDVTEDWNRQAERKGKPGGISAHVFSGDDNTFARFSIGIASGFARRRTQCVRESHRCASLALSPRIWMNWSSGC